MSPILVVAATRMEVAYLIAATGAVTQDAGPRELYAAEVGGRQVLIGVTGIGKVNAASAVTAWIERFAPFLLINTGCGGAYVGMGLAVGDLAVATVETYGDDGVFTPGGWMGLETIGIPVLSRKGRSYFNEFPLSVTAHEKGMQLATALGVPVRRGRFVTVSSCSGTSARGAELAARFDGICENMEGAAAAHIALLYGVDCFEVRGISNMVEERDLSRWDIPLAVETAQRFVLKYLEIA